ncbi:S9 family peptidase [uncultured Microbulbifer sp.]|uniref:S9 family peptidase n=1 Tax=uncultured Microbulbifer sp. TaxID=348147 RepID=UPI00260B57B1|nr:S9 family peptidase [uncultured Microbulbifer sp.]
MNRLLKIAAAIFIASPALAEEQPTNFSYEDVFNLEYVSDPQFSNDGKNIYYVRNSMNKMADNKRANLWRISADGKDHRPLTSGDYSDYSPRLSPDGKTIAFISSRSGSPQIHLLWLDNGQNLQISHLPKSPSNIQWSRDGKQIAFTMFVPESKPLPVELPGAPEGAKWAKPPQFIDRSIYRADGMGYLKQGYTQVFVIPREGGTPRQLTSGPFDHNSSLAWSKNNEAIYFSANRHPDHEIELMNSEIYRVDLKDGGIEQITERFGPDHHPQISPDGKKLAYLGFEDQRLGYQQHSLRIINLDSGESRKVQTAKDRSISSYHWLGDSKRIAYSYDDQGSTKIAIKKMGGSDTVVASDAGGLSLGRPYSGTHFATSKRGDIAYTQTNPQHPAELALARGGKVKTLTSLNHDLIPLRNMAQVEEINYKSTFDGRNIQGWVAYPPNFDPKKKYPLLLEIHGGPFSNYGPRFATEVQLFAAAGYVVLYTNPRGSTSYGHEFANLIHHNYPSQDYDDLMAGVDTVIDQGFINEEQLFVTGGSGGGTLTAWIIGKTDRFRAAVVAKPVINWESFVLTADYSRFFTKYWFSGMPWEKPEEYRRRSPLTYVGNVTTPTMLLTGEEDYRTPMSETEQFYQALKLNDVEAAMVRIPGASHSIAARPSQMIAKVASILYWFDQYKPDRETEDLVSK